MEFKSVATKRGDEGETDSFGAGRISKTHIAIELVGKLDLLQAETGIALATMQDEKYNFINTRFKDLIKHVQAALFSLSGDVISISNEKEAGKCFFDPEILLIVEKFLADIEPTLPPIKNFCYPAGDIVACQLHKLRAVCREAETVMVRYTQTHALPDKALAFINRFSDLLFILARWVNIELGIGEDLWQRS